MPNDLKNIKQIMGVNDRYYIIHENGTDAEVLKNADKCIEDILSKNIVFDDKEYPHIIISKDNIPFRPEQIAEYFLSKQMKKGLYYDEAVKFFENLRKLTRWGSFSYNLELWTEKYIRDACFICTKKDKYYPEYLKDPDVIKENIDYNRIRFACYIAICIIKYGPSFASITANKIFGYIKALGFDDGKNSKKSEAEIYLNI